MQKKPCEKFLKLPQNHRFDEFSIFMNFMQGATPTLVAQTESGLDYTDIMVAQTESGLDYTDIMVTFTWHLHKGQI